MIKTYPLPKPDGAPMHCAVVVPKPKPKWWGNCGEKAVAMVDREDPRFKRLVCAAHLREMNNDPDNKGRMS